MKLTADAVQEAQDAMTQYAKENPGISNGEDFPEFAKLLNQHKVFLSLNSAATAMGMLTMMMLPKPAPEDLLNPKARLETLMAESPMRPMILDILYLGYKLGKRDAEIESLNNMEG